ncbi:hypothetical protein G3M48_003338 [Beauveria asiatica]|uniref:Uncharacterized protein n=1 Tax=Beauveria asiatica TaxID=1069075 RepID=A0AAW0S6T2_9HYPO
MVVVLSVLEEGEGYIRLEELALVVTRVLDERDEVVKLVEVVLEVTSVLLVRLVLLALLALLVLVVTSVLVVVSDNVGVTLETSDEVTKELISDCDRLVELLVSDVELWRDVLVTDSVLEVELELAEMVDCRVEIDVDVDPEAARVDEVGVEFVSDERVDFEVDSMLLPDDVFDWGGSRLKVVCEEIDDEDEDEDEEEDGKVVEAVSDELGVGIAFELDWTVLEVATEAGVELRGVEVDSGETVDRL